MEDQLMKIELTKNTANTLASLLVFADNPRASVNRQLTEINCKIEAGQLTAQATDRYALVQFTDTLEAADCQFRLTHNLAKFIKANTGKRYSGPVEIELGDGGEVTISLDYGRQSLTEIPSQAAYPELSKLLEGWKADTEAKIQAFRIDLLSKLAAVQLEGRKAEVWEFEQGQNPSELSGRPGPLLARHGKKLVAMVQPNLLRRD
jgi:hypothetical protein